MSVRGCLLVAIEGTHASGKTTLVHSLTAHFRAMGVVATCIEEPARSSPFIEEIVIHGKGAFDLVTEVDLFAAQITTTLRAARHHQLLICDKTTVNVLAYARLLLADLILKGSNEDAVLQAMTNFWRVWTPIYDAIFYCPDSYYTDADPLRDKVMQLQIATDMTVRAAYTELGFPITELPTGLSVGQRTTWVVERIMSVFKGHFRQREP